MQNEIDLVENYISEVISSLTNINIASLLSVADIIQKALLTKKMIFTIGNGGSAANASHFCNDLVKGASYQRPHKFRAMCLTDNISTLSAYANDVDYKYVFSEPLDNFAEADDVLFVLSGSGNSNNLIEACVVAKSRKMKIVAILGFGGGKVITFCDEAIVVSGDNMERAEDLQLVCLHAIRKLIEYRMV